MEDNWFWSRFCAGQRSPHISDARDMGGAPGQAASAPIRKTIYRCCNARSLALSCRYKLADLEAR